MTSTLRPIAWVCLVSVRIVSAGSLPPIDVFFQPMETQTICTLELQERLHEGDALKASAPTKCTCGLSQRVQSDPRTEPDVHETSNSVLRDSELKQVPSLTLKQTGFAAAKLADSVAVIAPRTLASALRRRKKTFTDAESVRLAAALRARGDKPISRSYVESCLGDLARTKSVKAVQTKLLRMRTKGWQLGCGRYTEAEEEYMLAETERYRRRNPTRAWTRSAIQRHFPEIVSTHGLEPLRLKLNRLFVLGTSPGETTANTDTSQSVARLQKKSVQKTHKSYAPEEIGVLVRAALDDSFPSDIELQTVLKDRTQNAIRLKIHSLRTRLLRGQPELTVPLGVDRS